jgi:hypothetical protein
MNFKKLTWIPRYLPLLLFWDLLAAQIPLTGEPHHKVVFENEYIRLFDAHIPFHDTTLLHRHAAQSVVVFLSKSRFGIQILGEKPEISEVNPGDLKYVAYGEKPVTHIVWNDAASIFHFFVIELKKQDPGKDSCSDIPQEGVTFQWQQKLVTAYHVNILKGKSCKLQKSNCAYLLVDISGSVITNSSGNTGELLPNRFVFYPPQKDILISGSNTSDARCVLLKFE